MHDGSKRSLEDVIDFYDTGARPNLASIRSFSRFA
jgi:cytochrome c peroxidase